MSGGLIALIIFAALTSLAILWLLCDWARLRLSAWREDKAMRLRDERLRRFGMLPMGRKRS
jgi:hypothetical protein